MSPGPAAVPAARPRASLAEGTRFDQLDSHTYRIRLDADFCVGAVPNGGYTASCMLAAASAHLSSRGQPDTFTAHFEYVHKTVPGPAIVVVDEVKLGRQVSTLHLTLWQGELADRAPWFAASSCRRKVLAYTTHVRLAAVPPGPSYPAGCLENRAAAMPAVPDLDLLRRAGTDGVWERDVVPRSAIANGSPAHWLMFVPRNGQALTPGVCDVWIAAAAADQPITQAALPYVVDSFPFELLSYLVAPGYFDPAGDADERARRRRVRNGLWFPTVVLNLEVKRLLPSEGVGWLNMSITSRQMTAGSMDIEVVVRDLAGDLVALGSQVAMIMGIERNTGSSRAKKAAL
ncbi:hypothetical protein E4U41_006449 [Claviceps citrina]|nr:hypothetical protein E4U41_006449 [Claviceps citrina]